MYQAPFEKDDIHGSSDEIDLPNSFLKISCSRNEENTKYTKK